MHHFILDILTAEFQEYAAIKMYSDIVHGPRHLHSEIKAIKKSCGIHQQLLLKSVQQNGFFAHPHCLLVAMLGKPNIL